MSSIAGKLAIVAFTVRSLVFEAVRPAQQSQSSAGMSSVSQGIQNREPTNISVQVTVKIGSQGSLDTKPRSSSDMDNGKKPFGSSFSGDDDYETVLENMLSVSEGDLRAVENRIRVYTQVPWPGTPKFTFIYGDDKIWEEGTGDTWSEFAIETIMSDGSWVNEKWEPNKKAFSRAKVQEKKAAGEVRAMTTNAFPAVMSAKKAEQIIERLPEAARGKYLRPAKNGSGYTLVHTWTENANAEYISKNSCEVANINTISSGNPGEIPRTREELEALTHFKETIRLLLSKTDKPIEWDPKLDNLIFRCVKGGDYKGFESEMAFVGYPQDLTVLMKAHPTLLPLRAMSQAEVQKTAIEFAPERGVLITHVQDSADSETPFTKVRYRKLEYKGGAFTVEERLEFPLGEIEEDEDELGAHTKKWVLYTRKPERSGDEGKVHPMVKPLKQFYQERTDLSKGIRLDDAELWKKFREQDRVYLASLKKHSENRGLFARRLRELGID